MEAAVLGRLKGGRLEATRLPPKTLQGTKSYLASNAYRALKELAFTSTFVRNWLLLFE